MSKLAVVYYSSTGNTEAMAEAVLEGMKGAGAEAELFTADSFNPGMMDDFDAVAFGCPACGSEELDDTEFDPMFTECEGKLSDKKIILFGSHDWGDGEWMRTWEGRCKDNGAVIVGDEGLICENTPEDDVLDQCKSRGAELVAAL